ncbi:tetratricopeptide repeat protein, partial [Parabacteroides johnsonii]
MLVWEYSGAMLTATPLVGDSALANGIVMGKVFWFHLSMALMAIGTIVTIGFGRKKGISFSLPDGLLLLFAGVTLVTYDWQLGPEPEKLLFGGQLIVLWFLLRHFLTEAPCLKFFFLFMLMLTGLVEAVWGMQQLHGHVYSHYSLFRLTGSFFNPGPYSGYLAVVLPVCLWTAIRVLERAKRPSGDPMIRYMIAKNRQALGDYREAERELLQAIEILPERLYPYYLLAKLYAESEFYQEDKFR